VFGDPSSAADDKIDAMKHAYERTMRTQYFNTAIRDILEAMH
jgi:hypothetical protein